MSLITRCPACRTMFKVVPDQLRVSEGWVRCGKCEEIFDAAVHMQEDIAPAEPAPAPSDLPSTETLDVAGEVRDPVKPGKRTSGSSAAVRSRRVDVELHEGATQEPALTETAVASSDLLPPGSALTPAIEPRLDDVPAEAEPQEAVAARKPSFMRDAKQPSRWHRPIVRAVLIVLSLLLSLTLVLQWLVQERDRVAAVEPGLRPVLQDLCLLIGCEVRPLRQIESVVIDSSAFTKVRGDNYRLSLTLKNQAPIDLAMPAIELALTDTLDHPIVRRVLHPEELGSRSRVIAASSEVQTTLVLTIKANGNGERIAGYRLLAFYP